MVSPIRYSSGYTSAEGLAFDSFKKLAEETLNKEAPSLGSGIRAHRKKKSAAESSSPPWRHGCI